jgi:hypothetical protein
MDLLGFIIWELSCHLKPKQRQYSMLTNIEIRKVSMKRICSEKKGLSEIVENYYSLVSSTD